MKHASDAPWSGRRQNNSRGTDKTQGRNPAVGGWWGGVGASMRAYTDGALVAGANYPPISIALGGRGTAA